jgi:hypothetical protein
MKGHPNPHHPLESPAPEFHSKRIETEQKGTTKTIESKTTLLLGKSHNAISNLPPIPEGTIDVQQPLIPDPTEPPPEMPSPANCYEQTLQTTTIPKQIQSQSKPSAFISMISLLLAKPKHPIEKPPFQFKFDMKAASHNWSIISKHGTLDKTIRAFPLSPIHYGSEFKDHRILHPLLHRHHYWPHLRTMLTNGSTFPLVEQDGEKQLIDFDGALTYGNHKSAKQNMKILLEHIGRELKKGWIVPLLPEDARKIPNAVLSPMGVVSQSTINEFGEIIPSNRVTHDLSFPGKASGQSVNSRTKLDELEPCRYGHMLLRTIHYIVALRLKNPYLPIVLQKTDFKSAYRRQHLSAETAAQCMSSIEVNGTTFVMLNLRLTFGGSACPSEWCIMSETITDLANKILNHEDWDPHSIAPQIVKKVPQTELLEEGIRFEKAKPLLVDVPLEKIGKSDVYIDDVCTVGVLRDGDETKELKLKSSVLLAMELVGRPISEDEPIPRDPFPSVDKLLSEAGLSEVKCLLGWILDTRRLRVRLHTEKHAQWTNQLLELTSGKSLTSKKVLEVTLGRLNHAASILPLARHFLCRLSYSTSKADYFKPIKLNKAVINDLRLWIKILDKLESGISMNLLTFRPPDIIIWTDACEYGIGGYSSPRGRAWKWPIPVELQQRAHINILEFIAVLVGVWIEIIEGSATPETCILAFGDNTSAMGWINRSKYRDDEDNEKTIEAKLTIARKLASISIENDIRIFSQWFPGEANQVADFLSRNPNDKNENLSQTILSLFQQQVPKDFRISHLPNEIESFIFNTLSSLPKNQQPHLDIKDSDVPCGKSGHHSCPQLGSPTTTSSNHSNQSLIETKWSAYLPKASEKGMKDEPKEFKDWLQGQSEIPSACWLRPSWKMAFQIRD